MDIHIVRPRDTLFRIAQQYGVSMDRLIQDNQLPDPSRLVVGQTIVVRYPEVLYTVMEGDTLCSIAAMHHTSLRQLLRNNPNLVRQDRVYPGQVVVISYRQASTAPLSVNGYAYPSIGEDLLKAVLPSLTQLTPFTYRFTADGALVPPQDSMLVRTALASGVAPDFHLSNLDENDAFSPELAHTLLTDEAIQGTLIGQILAAVTRENYKGVDVDFEFLLGEDSGAYAKFLDRLRRAVSPLGLPVIVALAPKTADDQPGRLYEGHDYEQIARVVDFALLMTYDWGHQSGPPMAVAPLNEVHRVVDYALEYFRPGQLLLGVPAYGYNWTLPFKDGNRASSLSNIQAVQLAWDRHQAIRFDQTAQAPWFRYVDEAGAEHEVWFEDARSVKAKAELALEHGLHGVSIWNLDRPFPQSWLVLDALAKIRDGAD